jgi:hypothetical protein
VVVLHNGPLTLRQQCWVAALNAGPGAALSGRTALTLAGLRGEPTAMVEVAVGRGRRVAPISGVGVTRTRHVIEGCGSPPRQALAVAVVHAAIRAPTLAVARTLASEPLLRFTALAVRTEPARVLSQVTRGLAG